MKLYFFSILFSFFTYQLTSAQKVVRGKIFDSAANKPLPDLYFYILKNHDKWIDIGKTDSSGNFAGTIERKEFKKNATYQVIVDQSGYNIAIADIVLSNREGVEIRLVKNKNYQPRINGMIYKDCSSISFGYYYPKEPRNLSDLPDEIKEKIITHLKERVGANFFEKLILSGGQIVDLERLKIVDRTARKYKWTPQSYYLCFSFADTSLGIARYTAKIVLDKAGNVVEDIDLPGIKSDTTKGHLISMRQAQQVATKKGFSVNAYTKFEYDYRDDIFTWIITESEVDESQRKYHSEIIINAHNGKILDQFKTRFYDTPFN